MSKKNCKTRFSKQKFVQEINIIEFFSLEVSARKASMHLGPNYRTVKNIYDKISHKILFFQEQNFKKLDVIKFDCGMGIVINFALATN